MEQKAVESHMSSRIDPQIHWFRQRFARQLQKPNSTLPIIDLATAENWLIRDDLLPLVHDAASTLSPYDLSYGGGLGGNKDLLEAAAGFFNHFFSPLSAVQPEHLVAGAGASGLLDSLIYSICDAGDAILVEAPYWGGFEIYCALRNEVHLIPVFPPSDGTDEEAYVAAFEQAIDTASSKVRGLLFCNPQNPRGQVYRRGKIEALLRLCGRRELHFISDEVYALTAFDKSDEDTAADKFVSAMQMDLNDLGVDASRLHVLHSTSKDLGSSGLRMGFLITQSNPSLRFAMAILNHNKVSNSTSRITTHLLSDIPRLSQIVQNNAQRLADAAWIISEFLQNRRIVFCKPTAGIYIWTRLGGKGCSWEQEAELTRQLGEAGLAVGNGTDYTESQAGWFRITFAVPTDQLIEGLHRMAKVLERW